MKLLSKSIVVFTMEAQVPNAAAEHAALAAKAAPFVTRVARAVPVDNDAIAAAHILVALVIALRALLPRLVT